MYLNSVRGCLYLDFHPSISNMICSIANLARLIIELDFFTVGIGLSLIFANLSRVALSVTQFG
jgi:hypothetical protein